MACAGVEPAGRGPWAPGAKNDAPGRIRCGNTPAALRSCLYHLAIAFLKAVSLWITSSRSMYSRTSCFLALKL